MVCAMLTLVDVMRYFVDGNVSAKRQVFCKARYFFGHTRRLIRDNLTFTFKIFLEI
jgi:hypothetical protein